MSAIAIPWPDPASVFTLALSGKARKSEGHPMQWFVIAQNGVFDDALKRTLAPHEDVRPCSTACQENGDE